MKKLNLNVTTSWSSKKANPFLLITISLFLIIVSPNLFSNGMFLDGLLYADISRNLSEGIGSLWFLSATETMFKDFHEHPPLAFWLEGLLFYVLGDSIYVERVYSLLTFAVVGFLMMKIWQLQTKENNFSWLPLFFWILIPLVTWAASNNMLENTMSIFTTLAVFFYLKSLENHLTKKRFLFLLFSGFSLFLGFLSKGFVALFVWSAPLWFTFRFTKRSFISFLFQTISLISFTVLPLLMMFAVFPESYQSLQIYFQNQVVGSIENVQTVAHRFYITQRLFMELLPAFIIGGLLFVYVQVLQKKVFHYKTFFQQSLPFWLLGLSGVLPIMVSLKQSGFYILATFPFFSLALSILTFPWVKTVADINQIKQKAFYSFLYFAYSFLFVGVFFNIFFAGIITRDKEVLLTIRDVKSIVGESTILSQCPDLYSHWSLHAYFHRYVKISLDPNLKNKHEYFLTVSSCSIAPPKDYSPIDMDIGSFLLYQKDVSAK